MIKRVFLAVELPESIREELALVTEELKGLFDKRAVKWVKEENLHMTLLFLGSVREERTEKIRETLRCVRVSPFSVQLSRVVYHPPSKEKAKLIWGEGESKGLIVLKERVEEALQKTPEEGFKPHVTLGRVKKWELRKTPISAVPEIEEDINLEFAVSSFALLESKLKKEGPEYKLLERFKLHE